MSFPSKTEESGLDTRAFNNECAEGKNDLNPAPDSSIKPNHLQWDVQCSGWSSAGRSNILFISSSLPLLQSTYITLQPWNRSISPFVFSWLFTLIPNLTLHLSPVLNPYTIMSNQHWVQTWILLSESLSWQAQHYNTYSVQVFDCFQMSTQSRGPLYIQNVEQCCTLI